MSLNKKRVSPAMFEQVLLKNAVTKNVQNIVFPLDLIQNMLFHIKYHYQDNFIFANHFRTRTISLFGFIFWLILFLIRLIQYNYNFNFNFVFVKNNMSNKNLNTEDIHPLKNLDYSLAILGHIFAFIGYFRNTYTNVEIVLYIQKFIKSLRYSSRQCKRLIFINRFYCVLTIGLMILQLIAYVYINGFRFPGFILAFFVILFDANMVNVIRLTVIVKSFLLKWFNDIKSYQCQNIQNNDLFLNDMFFVYIDVLKLLKMSIKVFQDMVS